MSDGEHQADTDRAAAYWRNMRNQAGRTATTFDDTAGTIVLRLTATLGELSVAANNPAIPSAVLVEAAFDVLPWARAALAWLEAHRD